MEIAFFDRGPMDSTKFVDAGSWSAYWYNGHIYSSEIARGLDIYDLVPSGLITQNELDAAKSVHFDYFNTQDQPKFVWPPSFALARAYLDQLERDNGFATDKIAATRAALAAAEKLNGQAQKDALSKLSQQLHTDARSASDQPKAHKLAYAVGDLAK
jgi:protein-disulfide isomerase-like protein with CxxC motif